MARHDEMRCYVTGCGELGKVHARHARGCLALCWDHAEQVLFRVARWRKRGPRMCAAIECDGRVLVG